MFKRPAIEHNERLDAGGLTWTMVRPFHELRVDYSGTVCLLDEPLEMVDPKAAFTGNPHVACSASITFTGQGRDSMFGGEPDQPHEAPGEEFARGHYEQLVEGRGTLTVGDRTFEVHGYGLRDHSWGPRTWQAPWYYRWLTGNVGRDFGFMLSRIARRDGPGTRGGFVWEDGRLHLCDGAEVATTVAGDEGYQRTIEATLRSSRSGRSWSVRGEVVSLIPLRNRRTTPDGDLLVTRISEGLTRWSLPDGRIGYGLSEYLDQLVDGRPVGLAE
jgi:hypothetical protein